MDLLATLLSLGLFGFIIYQLRRIFGWVSDFVLAPI